MPAQAVPATDARVKLEADQVVSPGKRIKKESAAVAVKASLSDHLTIAKPLAFLQLVRGWEAQAKGVGPVTFCLLAALVMHGIYCAHSILRA